jgi:hypothetical protein
MINTINYNYNLNCRAAYIPVASTLIGLSRIIFQIVQLAKDLFQYFSSVERAKIEALSDIVVDLRGILRGFFELVPILGSLGSYLYNKKIASPAQKLAFKVQKMIAGAKFDPNKLVQNGKNLRKISKDEFSDNLEFSEFINDQWDNVHISTDEPKILEFLREFNSANWDSDVLKNDKMLPFYAMAAFSKSLIDENDMSTILNIYYARIYYKDLKVQLYDSNISFGGTVKEPTNHSQLDSLRQKKKIYFSCKPLLKPKKNLSFLEKFELLNLEAGFGTLYAQLQSIKGISYQEIEGKKVELYPSFDIEHRLMESSEGTKFFKPKLGPLKPLDIKRGVVSENGPIRYVATYFPGCKQHKRVHGSLEIPTIVTRHDIVHAHITKHYPPVLIQKILSMIQDYERLIGVKMSKEIWMLVDMIAENLLFEMANKNVNPHENDFFSDVGLNSRNLSLYELSHEDSKGTLFGFFRSYLRLKQEQEQENPNILSEYKVSDYTLKQNVWIIREKEKINREFVPTSETVPKDEDILFERIKNGKRKNTYRFKE